MAQTPQAVASSNGSNGTAESEISADGKYRIHETVKDPDGVIAKITERIKDGRISFSLAREYTDKGATKQTAFLSKRHIPAIKRILTDLVDRLETLEDQTRASHRG